MRDILVPAPEEKRKNKSGRHASCEPNSGAAEQDDSSGAPGKVASPLAFFQRFDAEISKARTFVEQFDSSIPSSSIPRRTVSLAHVDERRTDVLPRAGTTLVRSSSHEDNNLALEDDTFEL